MTHPREVTQTLYEWDIESTDEYGDVVDHDHHDKCPGLIARNRAAIQSDGSAELVLIRDVGLGLAGDPNSFMLDHRAWAYVKDCKLPETFDDGHPVPKRFHKELERANGKVRWVIPEKAK